MKFQLYCGSAVLEVLHHLGAHQVRAIALHRTAGLRRGTPVFDSGGPLRVPVSVECLGKTVLIMEFMQAVASLHGRVSVFAGVGDRPTLPSEVAELEDRILLDPAADISSGSLVSHTGERLEIGAGDALLGRIIDPLGKPLDGRPPPVPDEFGALEAASPAIVARDFVNRPLYTGIKVVDTMIPIGRGQRQLIISDSGTGKTSLCLDTVVAHVGQGMKCVYVMIGQKRSEAALMIDLLRRREALAYTTVVVGEATATPGMQYLAPFADRGRRRDATGDPVAHRLRARFLRQLQRARPRRPRCAHAMGPQRLGWCWSAIAWGRSSKPTLV